MISAGTVALGSLAGSLLSNAANVGTSIFGQSSQAAENQKNRDFALEMWNRQNEYNTPKHQAELLREGGYNPYILSDQGTVSQAGTPINPSTQALPTISPVENSIGKAAQIYQNGLQVESNIELQKMKSLESLSKTMLDVYKTGGQDALDEFMQNNAPLIKSLNFDNSFYKQEFDRSMKKLDLENQYQDIENKWLDVLQSDKHNLNKDTHMLNADLHKQYQETMRKIKAEIDEISSRADLNRAQKELLIKQRTGQIISNGLSALDFENQKELQKDIQEYGRERVRNLSADTDLKSTERERVGTTGKIGPFEYHPAPDSHNYYPFWKK